MKFLKILDTLLRRAEGCFLSFLSLTKELLSYDLDGGGCPVFYAVVSLSLYDRETRKASHTEVLSRPACLLFSAIYLSSNRLDWTMLRKMELTSASW